MRLTNAQREVLEWIGTNKNGVDCISDKRVVNGLLNKGLVAYLLLEDAWVITDAGRAALQSEGAKP
jgi:hypothetical protein